MKKSLKRIVICVCIAISMGLTSFTANAAATSKSTVLEDGTIHTRVCSDNGNIEDTYYAPERDDLYCKRENDSTYLLNATCNDNAEFEKLFSGIYGFTQLEDGSYDVYPSEIIYYTSGTNMTLDAAEAMAEELLKSPCVDTISVKKGYQIYDGSLFEVTEEIYLYSTDELTVDEFAWAADIGCTVNSVTHKSGDVYLANITGDSAKNIWENIYQFMLRSMEMSSVYAVEDLMIEAAIWKSYTFETVKIYTESAESRCDIDGNGTVEITDATAILQSYANAAAGVATASEENPMDVNGDGTVGIDDASFVLGVYAELAAGLR